MKHAKERRLAFGAALRAAREAQGLLQSDLAAIFDRHQPAISAWEAGRNSPDPPTVFLLEQILDLAPGDLSVHLGYMPLPDEGTWPTFEEAVMDDELLTDDQKRAAIALYSEFMARR